MENVKREIRYPEESFQIIGAAMKVHRALGPGFIEKVYQDALAVEFADMGIPFQREVEFHVSYKGVVLPTLISPISSAMTRLLWN